jgi:hypothetical protein
MTLALFVNFQMAETFFAIRLKRIPDKVEFI